VLELLKAKSGKRNYPARKSRKRKDSDGCIREMARLKKPRSSCRERPRKPTPNSERLSRGKDFPFSFTKNTTKPPLQ
jgi:hypothetical protein